MSMVSDTKMIGTDNHNEENKIIQVFDEGQSRIRSLFPFHIELSPELIITSVGKSLIKQYNYSLIGLQFDKEFSFKLPIDAHCTSDWLQNNRDVFVLFESRNGGLQLRGSVDRGSMNSILLLLHPWVTDAGLLGHYDIALTDFPPHDPFADLLMTLQFHKQAASDANTLSADLRHSQKELARRNDMLNMRVDIAELIKVSQISTADLQLLDTLASAMVIICSYLSWEYGVLSLYKDNRLEHISLCSLPKPKPAKVDFHLIQTSLVNIRDTANNTTVAEPPMTVTHFNDISTSNDNTMQDLLNIIGHKDSIPSKDVGSIEAGSGLRLPIIIQNEIVAVYNFLNGEVRDLDELVTRSLTDIISDIEKDLELSRAETEADQLLQMEVLRKVSFSIAHDINNTLGILMGNLDLLESELAPESTLQTSLLVQAQEATTAVSNIVSGLIDVSQGVTTNLSIVDLRQVFEEHKNILASLMGDQIEIHINIDNDLWVNIDTVVFINALSAIILNAKEALLYQASINPVHIAAYAITCDTDEKEAFAGKKNVCIQIQDTGPGMSIEVIENAFKPFYSTKPNNKGLGLYLADRYVKAMQGKLNIKSSNHHGTIFTITLPLVEKGVISFEPG